MSEANKSGSDEGAGPCRHDRLNGPRGAIGACHLITGVAQANPTPDGHWLDQDSPLTSPEKVQALDPVPGVIIYQ